MRKKKDRAQHRAFQRPVLAGPFRRTVILSPSAPASLCDANLTFSAMLLTVETRREEIEGV
jgi:hypothetical protein